MMAKPHGHQGVWNQWQLSSLFKLTAMKHYWPFYAISTSGNVETFSYGMTSSYDGIAYSLVSWLLVHRKQAFLAATKQLKEHFCPSACPLVHSSVCLSHCFHNVSVIVSSWNRQELLSLTKVMSMQEVKVRGQRSRSQRSKPNLTVSGL